MTLTSFSLDFDDLDFFFILLDFGDLDFIFKVRLALLNLNFDRKKFYALCGGGEGGGVSNKRCLLTIFCQKWPESLIFFFVCVYVSGGGGGAGGGGRRKGALRFKD